MILRFLKFWLIPLLLIVAVMVGVALQPERPPLTQKQKINYKVIYINNMPCIHIPNHGAGGLTCDWAKYQSELPNELSKM